MACAILLTSGLRVRTKRRESKPLLVSAGHSSHSARSHSLPGAHDLSLPYRDSAVAPFSPASPAQPLSDTLTATPSMAIRLKSTHPLELLAMASPRTVVKNRYCNDSRNVLSLERHVSLVNPLLDGWSELPIVMEEQRDRFNLGSSLVRADGRMEGIGNSTPLSL